MPSTLQKILSLLRVSNALPVLYTDGTLDTPAMDERGAAYVQNVINGPGSANLMLAGTDDTDNQASTPLVGGDPAPQVVVSRLYGLDSAGNNWDRLRVAGNNADGVAVETIGILKQAAALYGFNGATFDRLLSQASNGDAVATSTLGLLKQAAFTYIFNGATFDRMRGNVEGTALASAARTATTNGPDITNYNNRGIIFFLNITAAPGIDTILLSAQARDPISGNYAPFNIAWTAQSATGLTLYVINPPVTATAIYAGTTSGPLPRTFRPVVTHSGAGSFTYSLGYSILS